MPNCMEKIKSSGLKCEAVDDGEIPELDQNQKIQRYFIKTFLLTTFSVRSWTRRFFLFLSLPPSHFTCVSRLSLVLCCVPSSKLAKTKNFSSRISSIFLIIHFFADLMKF